MKDPVAELISERTGLVFSGGRERALQVAVAEALARTGMSRPEDLAARLERDPAALAELIDQITVPETYFFRGPEQFEVLRREVLPERVRSRPAGHRLRLLSAACATGEEPYSLAIALEEEGLAGRSAIVATDISRRALARAKEAVYGGWSLRNSDDAFRARYFTSARGGRWRLHQELRRRVELVYQNLADDPSALGRFDVIFCRNALIYLSAEVVARVAARLYAALSEGGWLFTSPADPPLAAHAPFETVTTRAGIVYRRLDKAPAPRPIVEPTPPLALPRKEPPRPQVEAPRTDEPLALAETASALRALADARRIPEAIEAAAAAARRFPLSAEVQYLLAVCLQESGRDREAAGALRRALYLDPTLVVAALALGLTLRRLGESGAARRALARAGELLRALPPDALVPLADGERAGRMCLAVRALEEQEP